ncbi:MAG: UDP-N-acetylmuramate dehydrogenase [Sedimentisphaerales bacterium]|nr:UDP-N-acetylmuramate dehydrogenase [Sedimentisphaerales bacterium]
MNIFNGLEEIVESGHPLAKETWYGLGGPADYFIKPQSIEQLQEVVKRCNENNLPIYVLGFGSNLLVADEGVKGAVIQLKTESFSQMNFDKDFVTAGAGVELGRLLFTCARKGLSGLEPLSGIPGSMGGSVRMNAGGNFGDIGAVVESVTLMDKDGKIFQKSKPELQFDYRKTNITTKFILEAKINLTSGNPDQITRNIKEIWVFKKNNQPLNTINSGCIFKNPRGLSAGALIDRTGLKGLSMGGAVVSEKHANFIIAQKGCTSKDVIRLIDLVREKVTKQFNIELELEIEIWK